VVDDEPGFADAGSGKRPNRAHDRTEVAAELGTRPVLVGTMISMMVHGAGTRAGRLPDARCLCAERRFCRPECEKQTNRVGYRSVTGAKHAQWIGPHSPKVKAQRLPPT